MKTVTLTATVLAAGALASPAWADGLPVVDIDVGPSGVVAPAQDARYVTLGAGPRTVVARVKQNGGRVIRSRVLRGRYTIPAVAYDGSAAGLSADGSSLVLITPRPTFPRTRTSFAVLDAEPLRLRSTLTLPGDYSFDALSPDARWMYLIHYTSAKDPLQYEVQALDLLSGKLNPEPIVDPHDPDENMNGRPLTRATSPDGRWAYTLYEGTEHPFVHALDTVGRDARCIDLEWLHGRKDLGSLRFAVASPNDDGLTLRARDGSVAVVDTRTFEAAPPTTPGRWWMWLLAPAAALLAAIVFAYRISSRRAASTSFGGATSA